MEGVHGELGTGGCIAVAVLLVLLVAAFAAMGKTRRCDGEDPSGFLRDQARADAKERARDIGPDYRHANNDGTVVQIWRESGGYTHAEHGAMGTGARTHILTDDRGQSYQWVDKGR